MRISTAVAWLVAVLGMGQVGLAAVYILNRSFTVGIFFAVFGLVALVAAVSVTSLTRRQHGLGPIY